MFYQDIQLESIDIKRILLVSVILSDAFWFYFCVVLGYFTAF